MPQPLDTAASWLRCPRTQCDAYGKRLRLEVGQDHNGEQGLTVEHRCPDCGYVEFGPRNPTVARKTSAAVIERIRRQRELGWVVPMKVDTDDHA